MELIKSFVEFLNKNEGALMVIITFVYVFATILICIFNGRSAKASREQVSESQRQFNETNRPYITCEYILINRLLCGIRICNHGNQVARNLTITINDEFLSSLDPNEFKSFKNINESTYTIVGIGQSFEFYFSSVRKKPTTVPLVALVKYRSTDKEFEDVFEIDLSKQLPIESVDSDFERFMMLVKEQNQILTNLSTHLESWLTEKENPDA